jgi:V/A-type H+-transporting ATPase subunit I
MKLVRAFGNLGDLDQFIREFCIDGHFQVENAMDYIPKKINFAPFSAENPYTEHLQMIDQLSKEFGIETKQEHVMEISEDSADVDYLRNFLQKIKENFNERSELQKQFENNKNLIENYEHFTQMDINLKDIFDCEFTKFRFGYLPRESYEKLQMNMYKDNPFINFMKGKEVKDGYWGAYIVPVSKKEEIDNIFTKLSFEKAFVPAYNGNAQEAIEETIAHNEDIQKKIEALTNELADYVQLESERYSKLCAQIYALNTVFELKLNAAIKSEEDYFIFVGWIKADYEETFMQRSKKFDDIMVECEDPGASIIDKIPISLKNNWLFRPFSYFVEMFGLPAYTEIDPTPLFAITYSLMFGLMFADLGQGLVVILIGFLMHKFKKMPLGQILMRCGIFSCIFGAVFGSVFGMEDLLDGVYKSLGINLLPIKVFENTTKILILAISAGVFLMLLVMLIHTICSFKLKQYADAIFSANGIAGILAYSSMVFLATDFMANDEVKQKISVVNKEAVITTLIVGVVMMFFYEFVKEKLADKSYKLKPGSYLLSNIIELFESILSFFSNTVSYLRLGAFVLVHAGMMMVVTTLAGEKVNVTFVIVMILGNALVIALEALLTGIQSLRLQFYEMFSRYYSGQGRAFTPVNIYEEKD